MDGKLDGEVHDEVFCLCMQTLDGEPQLVGDAVDDVAEQMGLSATYASKQIKAYTGTNVVNYINNLRIEHAKELLETTKMSSNEIGAYVGFRYSQSFIRSFRKIVGMTPGNYRSLHKKDGKVEAEALKNAQQEKETTE